MMDREKINYFKEILINKRNEVKRTLELMDDNQMAIQNQLSPSELSNYDNHPAEIASEIYQVQIDNTLRILQEESLRETDEALDRIYEGTYGTCTNCGEEISIERLEVLPTASLCKKCEDINTREKYVTNRRVRAIEEDIIKYPFGRKYLNKREDDEYEGLDYLNDLIKYGNADSPQDMGGYHDYEDFYTNEADMQGIVDNIDNISNEDYRRQLPD